MEVRPHRKIERKKTKEINVGNVSVGGKSKISVQSMTNTLTTDIKKTIQQIRCCFLMVCYASRTQLETVQASRHETLFFCFSIFVFKLLLQFENNRK